MGKGNLRTVYGLTLIASLFCVVSIVWILVQSYFITACSGEGCIVWHEECYALQFSVFLGRVFFKTSFYGLLILFMVKQCRAIKCGVIFPRANVSVLYAIASCYLIGEFCDSNMASAVMPNDCHGGIVVNADTMIYTLLLFIFAILYKVAVNVSEENNLTI